VVPVAFRYNPEQDTIDIGGVADVLPKGGATIQPGLDPEMSTHASRALDSHP
jgi:hypothetical protein